MIWTIDQLLHLLSICDGKYDAFEKGVKSIEAHMVKSNEAVQDEMSKVLTDKKPFKKKKPMSKEV